MANDPNEKSASGGAVLRHQAKERALTPATPPPATLEELEGKLAAAFGKPKTVLHELISELVHLDVHLVPPSPQNNHWTLFTTGMSDLPMHVPEGVEDLEFAELVLMLPPEWPVDRLTVTPPPQDAEAWYWPVRWLKQLARLPHAYETWLGPGHTVPNGDPVRPFAPETKLCAFVLLPPVSVPGDARRMKLSDGRTVNIYVLHALHLEELNLKLNRGIEALLDAFDSGNVSEVLDISRKSTVRKKLFGLF